MLVRLCNNLAGNPMGTGSKNRKYPPRFPDFSKSIRAKNSPARRAISLDSFRRFRIYFPFKVSLIMNLLIITQLHTCSSYSS